MFHQTIFYPSRSAGNMAGLATTSAASPSNAASTPTPEKTSSFMDLRKEYFQSPYSSPNNSAHQRFGFGASSTSPHNSAHQRFGFGTSSTIASTTTTTITSMSECQNAVFVHSSATTPSKEPIAVAVGPPRLGAFSLNRLGLPPRAPLFASPEHGRRNAGAAGPKVRRGSDAETATTASVGTSVSSPTPSFLSNASSMDNDGMDPERIEFVLDDHERLPDWLDTPSSDREEAMGKGESSNSENVARVAKIRAAHDLDDDECAYEYEDLCKTDGEEDDDICSCCTPILKNTSRPQQEFHQQQAFVSREEGSVMTTTTTETKTTTTTTTQTSTSSSVQTSESLSRTMSEKDMVLLPHLFSQMSQGQNSDVPLMDTETQISNINIAEKCESSSAIATTTSTAVAEQPIPCCKACASKQRQIDRQRRELRHMKGMMKKLCLLLADTVREQENKKLQSDGSNQLACEERLAITDGENGAIVPATPSSSGRITHAAERNSSNSGEEGDSFSVATSITTVTSRSSSASVSSSSSAVSSKFVPLLQRRRITSLPVKSVGSDCPRIRNHRIMVSGSWGTYSGPTLSAQIQDGHADSKSEDDDSEDESSDARILLGCVVRLDDASLYVGSLSRNDTGSFIFHPPGTLYDSNGKPMRRIR